MKHRLRRCCGGHAAGTLKHAPVARPLLAAFTLIELLVVIAILAILAAMLFPDAYPTRQPTLNSVYADFHASSWKVQFLQNGPGSSYDPNWLTYINGVLDTGEADAGTVENAWDVN
jgi:prepilin-type N-terminal cleavage/methylation domain-containing protein